MCGLPDNAKTPRPGGFAAWPGCCFARKILLLVFVDLDIARGAFILPEQQIGGQGDSQCGEDGEQSFENFHGIRASLAGMARAFKCGAGDVPQGH